MVWNVTYLCHITISSKLTNDEQYLINLLLWTSLDKLLPVHYLLENQDHQILRNHLLSQYILVLLTSYVLLYCQIIT
jgi:hypothetical protein